MEINEDRSFQERYWKIQRIGWVLMGLLVLIAAAGLTGKGGPLAHATIESGGATIEYPRISRWQAADDILITFSGDHGGTGTVELSDELLRLMPVQSIQPQPSKSVATSGGHRLEFDLGGGSGPKRVMIDVRPSGPGWAGDALIRVGQDAPQSLSMLVLP